MGLFVGVLLAVVVYMVLHEGGGDGPASAETSLTLSVAAAEGEEPVSVTVSCDDGAEAAVAVCERLESADLSALEPVPANQPCTMIYGGDAVATLTGILRGERVDWEFSLANGCEIARWKALAEIFAPLGLEHLEPPE